MNYVSYDDDHQMMTMEIKKCFARPWVKDVQLDLSMCNFQRFSLMFLFQPKTMISIRMCSFYHFSLVFLFQPKTIITTTRRMMIIMKQLHLSMCKFCHFSLVFLFQPKTMISITTTRRMMEQMSMCNF